MIQFIALQFVTVCSQGVQFESSEQLNIQQAMDSTTWCNAMDSEGLVKAINNPS